MRGAGSAGGSGGRGGGVLCFGDSFSTGRVLRVHDPMLRLNHLVLQVVVVVYVVVVQLVLQHRYAAFEAPVAHSNAWVSGVDRGLELSGAAYCGGAGDWGADHTAEERAITSGYSAVNSSCREFDPRLDVVISASHVHFRTFERLHWTERGGNGTNETQRSLDRFVHGVDAVLFNQIHAFSASFLKRAVTNPETWIWRGQGEQRRVVRKIKAGEILGGIPLQDWIGFADISLDEVNEQPWLRQGQVEEQPLRRLTGVVLLLHMEYTNRRPWELPQSSPRCDISVEVLPEAWGYMGVEQVFDFELDRMVTRESSGVLLQFVPAGSVGTPSLFSIVLRLIEAMVLFNLAAIITNQMAEGFPLPCCNSCGPRKKAIYTGAKEAGEEREGRGVEFRPSKDEGGEEGGDEGEEGVHNPPLPPTSDSLAVRAETNSDFLLVSCLARQFPASTFLAEWEAQAKAYREQKIDVVHMRGLERKRRGKREAKGGVGEVA